MIKVIGFAETLEQLFVQSVCDNGAEVWWTEEPYRMQFDVYTIKHFGLQMYSALPSVIGKLVTNCAKQNGQCHFRLRFVLHLSRNGIPYGYR